MKVVVIIPTYNEKDNIERLIAQVLKVGSSIKSHHVEILVVDDNSPDGTDNVVKNLQKKNSQIHLITGKKEGLGKAYLRGMTYAAKELGAEVMFEMDADFSHNPADIPKFLKKIDQGYDLVIGSRYIKGGSIPKDWGFHRKLLSVFGNIIVRTALWRFGHKEWTNGFRAIKTPLFLKIKSKLEKHKGYTFQVSFLNLSFEAGAKVAEVPINFVDRVHGHSKIGSEYVFNLLQYLATCVVTNPPRPYRFAFVGALGFIVQTIIFTLGWKIIGFAPYVATVIGAEVAIISNFLFNNYWTFSDRKIKRGSHLRLKFIMFNFISIGSPLIQFATIKLSTMTFSYADAVVWPAYFVGIALGMIWNYLMYSKVIWKKNP